MTLAVKGWGTDPWVHGPGWNRGRASMAGGMQQDGLVLCAETLTATEWDSLLDIGGQGSGIEKGKRGSVQILKWWKVCRWRRPLLEGFRCSFKRSRHDSMGRTRCHIRDLGLDPKPTTSQMCVSLSVLSWLWSRNQPVRTTLPAPRPWPLQLAQDVAQPFLPLSPEDSPRPLLLCSLAPDPDLQWGASR